MSPLRTALWLCGLGLSCLALIPWALGVGSSPIPPLHALSLLLGEGGAREMAVLWGVRLPRVMAALVVGAALALAGVLLQRLTRNPLAEPGLLGINAGAAFGIVLASVLGGTAPRAALIGAGMLGAGFAALAVFALASAGRGGATPLRLVLSGVVVASFLAALTTALLIFNTATFEATRIWSTGSLAGIQSGEIRRALPWIGAGIALALLSARQIEILGLGEEVARGLGLAVPLWRGLGALAVVLLAAGATAIAGPLAFLGLVVPHALRLASGAPFRALLPMALIGGAALCLLADTLPRALWGRDIPVGISVALIGAPLFLRLAMRRGGGAA